MSQYAAGLTPDHLNRYVQKISLVGKDPYLLKMDHNTLPECVTYESIIEYALHKKSSYTGESMHCFKAVEAKQRFESGMVKLVEGTIQGGVHVIRGKVNILHHNRMLQYLTHQLLNDNMILGDAFNEHE